MITPGKPGATTLSSLSTVGLSTKVAVPSPTSSTCRIAKSGRPISGGPVDCARRAGWTSCSASLVTKMSAPAPSTTWALVTMVLGPTKKPVPVLTLC